MIDEIEINAVERAELVAEVIDDIYISKRMRPALEEESIDEIEINAVERPELYAEVIDEVYIARRPKPDLEEESIDEINIAAKTTWDSLVVAEDSGFELAGKPVSELEVIGVDSFDVQALVRPTLDMEYLDEIQIDIDYKCFNNDLYERNIKYTEMESVDEIGIAGQPIPENLEEYITEEVVETTTTTNLRNATKGATRTTETVTETTSNRRGNNDNMGRKVIVESSQTVTKSGRTSGNDNMGRKVITQTSQTTTTSGNRYATGDNMGRKVIVESTTITRGGDSATGASRFSAMKSTTNNDNMGRKVIVESSTRKGETSQGSSRRATHNSGYGGMSKKTIVETTTTTTTGYGAKKGASGYSIENVALNKSGSGAGSSYYKEERRVTRTTGERKPWEVDATNGDEVFAGRHPSDEEVSTGGNGYTKYSIKKEVKYQPSSTSKGATSTKASKFSVQRTSGK